MPLDTCDTSATLLTYCVFYVRQRDEQRAMESLESMVGAPDFDVGTLPLVIKEAQEAKMVQLASRALSAIVRVGMEGNSASEVGLPVVMRTVLKLQLDAAERDGGFTSQNCENFFNLMVLALEVVDKSAMQAPEEEESADIAAWMLKTTYNVSHEDRHAISPEQRALLSEVVLDLFHLCNEFSKPLDDESYHVCLWALLHLIVAKTTAAKGLDKSKEGEYEMAWQDVVEACNYGLKLLEEVIKHNAGAVASFDGTDTAIDVILVEALTNLMRWDKVEEHVVQRQHKFSLDGVQAIAQLVLNHKESTVSVRVTTAWRVIEGLWDTKQQSAKDVGLMAVWMQQLIQIYLDSQPPEYGERIADIMIAARNTLKSDASARQQWPRDQLQWMQVLSVSGCARAVQPMQLTGSLAAVGTWRALD